MNSDKLLQINEFRLIEMLEGFFIEIFNEELLYSHGLNHHRRVWSYARDLLSAAPKNGFEVSPAVRQKLIVACYLHDSGMAIDSGFLHGKHSRTLCEKFLVNNAIPFWENEDLLDTIEQHDNKEYINNSRDNILLTLLSVADDLDAFGYTGIYRYSEIYLKRAVDPLMLGSMVRKNAMVRFMNFENIFSSSPDLIATHRKRYEILDTFFCEYEKKAAAYSFFKDKPSGECGVAEIFMKMVSENRSFSDVLREQTSGNENSIIANFFRALADEPGIFKI